jgi:hypothetical protein
MSNKLDVNNITADLVNKSRERKKELAFTVQKTHAIDDNSARMAILVETPFKDRVTEEALAVAINKQYPSVRYLPNSVHRMSATDPRMLGVFVARNNRTMSLDVAKEMAADTNSTMSMVNDTVFQDEGDQSIWTVQTDGEQSYLISQIDENITSLLGGLHTRSLATASAGLSMEEDIGAGCPIAFYDTRKGEIAFGIAVNGIDVYNADSDIMQKVEAAHVLNVDDANKIPLEEASTKADLLSYMQSLYGQNPAFMAQIRAIVAQIAV